MRLLQKKKEKLKEADEKKKHVKADSMAAKANLVREFNEGKRRGKIGGGIHGIYEIYRKKQRKMLLQKQRLLSVLQPMKLNMKSLKKEPAVFLELEASRQ